MARARPASEFFAKSCSFFSLCYSAFIESYVSICATQPDPISVPQGFNLEFELQKAVDDVGFYESLTAMCTGACILSA